MQKLIIKGKRYLSGKILISGSKNATLPILAACILSNNIKLQNIPLVKDIFTMIELLEFIGLKVKILKKQKTLEILNNGKKINRQSNGRSSGTTNLYFDNGNISFEEGEVENLDAGKIINYQSRNQIAVGQTLQQAKDIIQIISSDDFQYSIVR